MNRIFCFAAGTQVVVGINADGSFITRNIEDLKPGDLVLSRDEFEASARVEFKPIVATSEKTSDHLRIVTLMDEAGNIQTIKTTDEHPFFVAPGSVSGGGWTNANNLEGGQQLATADSAHTLTVLSSLREEHATGVKVYNFTVADTHTYFVTDAPTRGPPCSVWVHNVTCGPWSQVGGHHPISKAALRDAVGYVWQKALSAPEKLLKRLNVVHQDISNAQKTIFAALRRSGVQPTLLRIVKAEIQAMVQAGMKEGVARALIRRAIADLRRAGVTGPFRFPGS